jgi:hypothetical protein
MPKGDGKTIPRPYRVLLAGAPLENYFAASSEDKRELFLPRFVEVLAKWEELGARVVASFCDDVFVVGTPHPGWVPWYLIFEVDDLDVVTAMINAVRMDVDGIRLDSYVRFEARVGRPFWAREEQTVTDAARAADIGEAE